MGISFVPQTTNTATKLVNANNILANISNGGIEERLFFDWTIAGGIAGIKISKISYGSDTNELKVFSRPIDMILDNSQNRSTERIRILNDFEESALKNELIKSGYFQAGKIEDPGCADCFISYLAITIGNNTRSVSWNEVEGVVIPVGINNALKAIINASRTNDVLNS